MFVVMYDLSDMPPNSQTFLRQRTLYMPSEGVNDNDLQKWLRYLVHLRYVDKLLNPQKTKNNSDFLQFQVCKFQLWQDLPAH